MLKWFFLGLLTFASSLSAEMKVLAFAGSTRNESCNKKLIENIAEIALKMGVEVKVIELQDYPMPFYDADFEAKQGMPENAKRLRNLMITSQKIIIASPEYNGSLSGVLKNAIDWLSRGPDGQPSRDAFVGKEFAIMSCSPGPGGGGRGLKHLEAVITNIGGKVIAPQVAVSNGYTVFNSEGKIENGKINQEIKQELQELFKSR